MSNSKQPDPRDLRYFQFVTKRLNGASEGEIVAALEGPDIDSPQVLYRRLSNDGYPVCPECGTAPVAGTHCKPSTRKPRRLAAKGGGEAQELPPAAAASFLFHDALRSLQRDVEKLSHRRDSWKDGRFVAEHVLAGARGEAWQRHFRGDLSEQDWRKYCEEYGVDPSRDRFEVPVDSVQPGGTSQHPPEPLTRLIAVYVLSGYPVDLLLDRLHPDPETIDPQAVRQLRRHAEDSKVGLEKAARTVARLVRGGSVKPGRRTGELTPEEEDARAYIKERRQQGATDAQVLEELRSGHGFRRRERFGVTFDVRAWPDISLQDVQRLGNL